jgi:hypothetical protein
MTSKSCQSARQREFAAETNIHFPGKENLTKPTVWVFPKFWICLDCGFTEFFVPRTELHKLRNSQLSDDDGGGQLYGT